MRAARSAPAWILAACYAPAPPTGAPCSTLDACPEDQRCNLVEMQCETGPRGRAFAIGEDAAELRDTEVWLNEPNSSHGLQDHIAIDFVETGLLWFDLARVPLDRPVLRATLIVTTTEQAAFDGGTVVIHRMREPWDEHAATWTNRLSGQAWASVGARPPSREDQSVGELRPAYEYAAFGAALPPALIEEWIADPWTNQGIALVRGTTRDHVHLRSKESGAWSMLVVELDD